MRLTWQRLAAMGMAILLLALVVHPAASVALAAALVLTPLLLFGLITIPRSLWPAADLEPGFVAPIRGRTALFQRPPPVSNR